MNDRIAHPCPSPQALASITTTSSPSSARVAWARSIARSIRRSAVALKLLPAAFALDPMRIDRFKREARTVAALNHPHIVTIYSVEQDATTGARLLTMELVEESRWTGNWWGWPAGGKADGVGQRARRCARRCARQGHRASRSETGQRDDRRRRAREGAGLRSRQGDGSTHTGAEDETSMRTSDGVVLGTMPYMSPEQVEGREVDARSDVFSLGVLLHEARHGIASFRGLELGGTHFLDPERPSAAD